MITWPRKWQCIDLSSEMFASKAFVDMVDSGQMCDERVNKGMTTSYYLPNAEFAKQQNHKVEQTLEVII